MSIEIDIAKTLAFMKGTQCSIKKKKTRCEKKIKIPAHELVRMMMFPQPLAAEMLSVSISTLKRRYYEIGMKRWPITSASYDGRAMPVHDTSRIKDKMAVSFLLNDSEEDSREVTGVTTKMLGCIFTNKSH